MIRRRRNVPECNLEEQIAESAEKAVEPSEDLVGPDPRTITEDRLIPSGVTLLNCACSDNPKGAFAFGSINTIPGKSASGKTALMKTMLAACALEPRLKDHELVEDDAEESDAFDLGYLFPSLVGRLRAPRYDGDVPVHSNTIEDFEANMLIRCEAGKPFIYVLDSLDSLSSTAELEREYANALKNAKSAEEKEKAKQSYGTEKARIISQTLRMVNQKIKKSDSALFIIQQTKQNMNKVFKHQPDWTTTGGEAPYFYSFHRIYTVSIKSHTDEYKGVKHKIGGRTKAQVIKNKLNGKKRDIEFDIYEDLGIDDLVGNLLFLKKTKRIKSVPPYATCPDLIGNNKMYFADLVKYIEAEGLETLVQELVGEEWNDIEKNIRLSDRKRRFC